MKNKRAVIIVNSVTMTRVIGTFLMPFVAIMFPPGGLVLYIMILLLTDAADGFMARRLGACTIFGSLLDQGADKLLGIATLAILASFYPIMLLPILTEILIVLITVRGALRGTLSESSLLGKIKTWVLGVTIVVGFFTIYANTIIPYIKGENIVSTGMVKTLEYAAEEEKNIMTSIAFISLGTGLMVACDYLISSKYQIDKAKKAGTHINKFKLKRGKELANALFSTDYYIKTRNEPLIKKLSR